MPLIQQRVQSAMSQHTPLYGKKPWFWSHSSFLFFTPGTSNMHKACIHLCFLSFWQPVNLWMGRAPPPPFFFYLFLLHVFEYWPVNAWGSWNPLELKFHSCKLTHECWESEFDTPHQTPCVLENENWLSQVVLWIHTLSMAHIHAQSSLPSCTHVSKYM